MPLRHRPVAFAVAAVMVVALATGCTPTREVRGFVAVAQTIDQLEPGIDNQASVLQALGTPTALGTFDTNAWYYITRTTDSVAFFDEQVVDQQVVALKFDDAGVLASIDRFGLGDAVDITPVERTTPTRSRELGILEQFIGNIGRFNGPIE
ncbi:MAG: outer membrane protein assembly factor BamE [Proteobacteria bacterium]|nr:outer membrane protein assembly factor BamE [Pseudomonadota bacterium]